MSQKVPAFQFYVRDWLTDTELSKCSPATRGVWIDLLAAMWVAPKQGQLDGTAAELSRVCRCTENQMEAALTELSTTGTANVTCHANVTNCLKNVTVVNRRMSREANEREDSRLRQQRHRGHAVGNVDVTPPSASASSSASASASAKHPETPSVSPIKTETEPSCFEAFWSLWPKHKRKVGKSKVQKLWDSKGLDTKAPQIMLALEAFKKCEDWKKDGGQYIPMPSTWLNQERWDSDPKDILTSAGEDDADAAWEKIAATRLSTEEIDKKMADDLRLHPEDRP